jgi:hypothetical protein
MNSNDYIISNPLKEDSVTPSQSSKTSLTGSFSWIDAPLEALIAEETLVHNMTNEELVDFIKRCSTLRSSAQSRKAALKGDGAPKPRKQSNLDRALELLAQLEQKE